MTPRKTMSYLNWDPMKSNHTDGVILLVEVNCTVMKLYLFPLQTSTKNFNQSIGYSEIVYICSWGIYLFIPQHHKG